MRRLLVPLSLLACLVCAVYTGVQGLLNRSELTRVWGEAAWVGLAGSAASAACAGLVLVWTLRKPAEHESRSPRFLLAGFCVLVLWCALYQACFQPYERFTVEVTLGIAAGVHALLVWLGSRPSVRLPRAVGRALLVTCLSLVLLELVLEGLSVVRPSPLTATAVQSAPNAIRSHAFLPGEVRFGFPCNSGGYYDAEFLPAEQRAGRTAILIGDSFSAGIVPHRYHFTTVAERELGGVDLYNLGVAGIGPREYRHLLEHEALPLRPDAVVVNLFAGNDLADISLAEGTDRVLRRWLDSESLLVRTVPMRLLAIRSERERTGGSAKENAAPRIDSPEEILQQFPWLADHRLERAAFSEEAYLDLVADRARIACGPHVRRFRALCALLSEMREHCGEIPFAVVLIPAEFQVEDALWARVEARHDGEERLVRDRFQVELRAWLEAEGIPLLDLLPLLRAEPLWPSGDRHLYHLRDTHLNARGNEVTGRAVARFLAPLLSGRDSGSEDR